MITMEDIAKICGVSKATVSRVLNDKPDGVGAETRERIKKVIKEMEYRPNNLAQSIVNRRTKTIGLILPNIDNPFFPMIVHGVENYTSKKDYTVILGITDDNAEKEYKYMSTFISKRIDGVLLASVTSGGNESIQMLDRYNVPCVLLDRDLESTENIPGVFVDNQYATGIACEMLIKSGNRNIAFVSGPAHLKTSKERLEGFKLKLEEYGIPFCSDLLCYGDFSFESGYQAVCQLMDKECRFTAMLASNDAMAIGAMKALKEKGIKIPDELEIIGFDNIYMSGICEPALTTVNQPTYEMGKTAAEMLLKLIEGDKLAKKIHRIKTEMVIRDSTKKYRSKEI